MNCEQARPLVEEYFDGELDAPAAARVAAHVSTCTDCAAHYDSLTREQEFYLRAEPALDETGADLWAGVSARLGGERVVGAGRVARMWRGLWQGSGGAVAALKRPRFSPALTAASVLAAVLLTAGVMKYLDTRRQLQPATPTVARQQQAEPDASPVVAERHATPDAPPSASTPDASTRARGDDTNPAPAERVEGNAPAERVEGSAPLERAGDGAASKPFAASGVERVRAAVASAGAEAGRRTHAGPDESRSAPTSDELVREAEGKYVAAIALLARDVRRRRHALDSDEAARFERTLAAVDRAIAETRRAARKSPADPVAAQYMLAAYSKKVDLLREMASH